MPLSSSVLAGWVGHIVLSYYFIRPLRNSFLRAILAFTPCMLLTLMTSRGLRVFDALSLITLAMCWLTSIRLIHLNLFTRTAALSFRTFLSKILWTFLPLRSEASAGNQWPIVYQIGLIVMKVLLNHWIHRWVIRCDTRVSYPQILLYYGSVMTISYLFDAEAVLIRLVTRGKYSIESFTNFPILSLSLRDFWGRRYNRFVNAILKESIFEPIRSEWSAPTVAGLMTFVVSGLLHVHVALAVFDDLSAVLPTFMFFVLHGLACCLEANINIRLPAFLSWLITQAFLLVTAPLMITPFIKEGSTFLMLNPPPLIDSAWIPKLPVPSFCPN